MSLLKPLAFAAFLLFLPGFALAAAPPEVGQFPDINWTAAPPIKLDVAKLEIVNQYVPTRSPPHIEAVVPRTLLDAADQWARARLIPAGPQGVARLVITDASIVEVPLQTPANMAPPAQPPVRFDAHIVVRLEFYGLDNTSRGSVTAEASSTHSITNDVAGPDIARQQYLLVSDALRSLNGVFDNTIHSQLSAVILP
jgi:hypothetical protein